MLNEYADFIDEHLTNAKDKTTACEFGSTVLTNLAIRAGAIETDEEILAINRKALAGSAIRFYCAGGSTSSPEQELFCSAPNEETYANLAASLGEIAVYPDSVFSTTPVPEVTAATDTLWDWTYAAAEGAADILQQTDMGRTSVRATWLDRRTGFR